MAKGRTKSTSHEYKSAERSKAAIEQRPGESDIDYYTRLAKMADQRLVRLEKLATQEGYEKVLKYAYAAAIDDIAHYGGASKRLRFNTKPPEGAELFHEKIKDMKRFLSAPTSTKGGIDETYAARAKTINERYGTNFTWEDMADFFQSGDADKLFKEYGSKTVMQAIGVIQYKAEQVTGNIMNNQNVKSGDIPSSVALDIMISPKFQRTSLRSGMSKDTRSAIREELKGDLGIKPKKRSRKKKS